MQQSFKANEESHVTCILQYKILLKKQVFLMTL